MSTFENPKGLRGWFDRVKSERHNVHESWRDISEHQLGSRNFEETRTQGEFRNTRIYDTTAQQSHQLLAGALHGLLTNPATDWFDLDPENFNLFDDFESASWLADSKMRMLNQFQGQRSGFPTQSSEVYLDVPGYGMGGISVMGKGGNLTFSSHPLDELYVQTDQKGMVNTIFRELPLTARQWAVRFPNDVDEQVQRALADGKDPEKKLLVVQLIAPSDDPFAGPSPVRQKFTSVYFTARDTPRIIETKGFDEMPLLTPRWTVQAGENYGIGAGHMANPGARMLNEMQKTILKYAQKASDPALLATSEAVLSGIRMHPGGVTYVQQMFGSSGGLEPIRPIPLGGRHELSVDMLNRIQSQVRNAYYAQLLQLFDQPGMTATQVVQLAQQITQLMAPILGRMQAELLEPMVSRSFNLMLRGGAFLPIPTRLQGENIIISYVSPVARAQKQAEARAAMETWQAAAIVAQASGSPDALDVLDADATVRIIAEAGQAPRKMLRQQDEIEAIREQRSQQIQQQQALDQGEQGAGIAATLEKAFASAEGQEALAA